MRTPEGYQGKRLLFVSPFNRYPLVCFHAIIRRRSSIEIIALVLLASFIER